MLLCIFWERDFPSLNVSLLSPSQGISSESQPSDAFDDFIDSESFPPPPPPVFFDPSDLPTPSDSPPTVTEPEEPPVAPVRNSTARVSFREPISCSYSVEDDDWGEEETVEVNGKKEEEEQEDDGEEAVGSLGHRLRFCTGVPSQIDLLGKTTLLSKTISI